MTMPLLREELTKMDYTQTLFGRLVLQSRTAVMVYEALLDKHKESIHHIIEIGTGHGSLSLYFAVWCKLHSRKFYTIDTTSARWAGWVPDVLTTKVLADLEAEVVVGDCFKSPNSDTIIRYLQDGPCLLFCDGGDKGREIRTFGPYCQPGSIIVAHDWPIEVGVRDVQESGLDFHPWHAQSLEVGTKAAILIKK